MQKLLIISAFILVLIIYIEGKGNAPLTTKWEDFKNFHHKRYLNHKHEVKHKAIFLKNLAEVNAHNEAFNQGRTTYTKELNEWADCDPVEFNLRNGFKHEKVNKLSEKVKDSSKDFESNSTLIRAPLPSFFDWRSQGYVSEVKDQGQCGCCWAFAATGALESQVLINSQPSQLLSEQQLISCDINGFDQGCRGGSFTNVFDYIIKNDGIMSETVYPYTSGDATTSTCEFSSNSPVAQNMSSYEVLTPNNNKAIMTALVTFGPIAVGVDGYDWQLASDGFITCKQVNINHAVLIVGYGSDNGHDYWIVKNSWSKSWGNSGYINVTRSTDGTSDCGITTISAYPIL